MIAYAPHDFAHGLAVLRTRLAELDALGYDDQDRVDRFNAEVDDLLGRMIDIVAEAAGKSSAAADLILCLASGQDGGHVDLARIEALHNEFAREWGALHAAEIARRAAQAKTASKGPRTRTPSHPFTAQQLRRLIDGLGLAPGEHGLHERLAAAILDQTGKPTSRDQLRRLATAAYKLPRTR